MHTANRAVILMAQPRLEAAHNARRSATARGRAVGACNAAPATTSTRTPASVTRVPTLLLPSRLVTNALSTGALTAWFSPARPTFLDLAGAAAAANSNPRAAPVDAQLAPSQAAAPAVLRRPSATSTVHIVCPVYSCALMLTLQPRVFLRPSTNGQQETRE